MCATDLHLTFQYLKDVTTLSPTLVFPMNVWHSFWFWSLNKVTFFHYCGFSDGWRYNFQYLSYLGFFMLAACVFMVFFSSLEKIGSYIFICMNYVYIYIHIYTEYIYSVNWSSIQERNRLCQNICCFPQLLHHESWFLLALSVCALLWIYLFVCLFLCFYLLWQSFI